MAQALARAYRKARNQSENWARHQAAGIVSRYGGCDGGWAWQVQLSGAGPGRLLTQ